MVVKLAETCVSSSSSVLSKAILMILSGNFRLMKDSGSFFGFCFVLFFYFKLTKKLGSQCSSTQQWGVGRKRMDDTRSPPSLKVSKLKPRKYIIKKWRRFDSANKTALVSPNTGGESIICNSHFS